MNCEDYPFTVVADPYSITDRSEGVPCLYGQVHNAQKHLSLLWELQTHSSFRKFFAFLQNIRLAEDLWSAVSFNHRVNRKVHFIRATIGGGREFCCLVKFLNLQTDT